MFSHLKYSRFIFTGCSEMKTMMFRLILAVFIFGIFSGASAEIYKWKDDHGVMHFSSTPPAAGQVEQVHVQVNSFSSTAKDGKSKFKFNPGLITTRGSSSSKVVMYSTQRCGYCKQARRYFNKKGIPFSEYDVENTQKGKADYRKLNGRGVPIILVGNQRMDGFSQSTFEKLYQR